MCLRGLCVFVRGLCVCVCEMFVCVSACVCEGQVSWPSKYKVHNY